MLANIKFYKAKGMKLSKKNRQSVKWENIV